MSRTTSLLMGALLVATAGCAFFQDDWELLVDVPEGPAAMTSPVLAATDDARVADAWEEFDLSGEPPEIDHEETLTLFVTGFAACGGELTDVEVETGIVTLVRDDEAMACRPGEGERTFVLGLDRQALGDGQFIVIPVGARPFATESTAEAPPVPEAREGVAFEPSEVEATVGEDVELDLEFPSETAEPREADFGLLVWDGIQWRGTELPDATVIEPREGGATVTVPTDDLMPATYWLGYARPDGLGGVALRLELTNS